MGFTNVVGVQGLKLELVGTDLRGEKKSFLARVEDFDSLIKRLQLLFGYPAIGIPMCMALPFRSFTCFIYNC